jgi:hypothetical protein
MTAQPGSDSTIEQTPIEPASRPRLSRRAWALVLIAPLIMTGVAIMHHVLTTTSDLNPWKGGGFGMFATVDSPGNRRIVSIATLRNGQTYGNRETGGVLDFNDGAETSLRATTLPNSDRLRSMAREAIFFYELQIDDPNTDQDDVVSMRIEVFTVDFDASSNTATLVLVTAVDVEAS